MSQTFPGTGVSRMQMALILHEDLSRRKRLGECVTDTVGSPGAQGNTFLKGLTVTDR